MSSRIVSNSSSSSHSQRLDVLLNSEGVARVLVVEVCKGTIVCLVLKPLSFLAEIILYYVMCLPHVCRICEHIFGRG